ncbi:MAG: glycosyltransferase [Anaerotruncus sp.]|nr:glycosyltransferase [Anaerotruncus sp.]
MKNNFLVSVLILAYYSGEKLWSSIYSVLRQDYRPLQLIVCDDGTKEFDTTATERIITAQRSDVDFKVVHHTKNLGTVGNLNTALSYAKGKWIIPLAADDMFASEQIISKLIHQVSNSDARWMIAQTRLCDQQMKPTGQIAPSKSDIALLAELNIPAIYYRLCCDCFIPSSGTVYERKLLDALGRFDNHFQLVEDWPLFLKLVRMGYIPAVSDTVCVLHRDGGISKHLSGKNQRYQRDLVKVMEREVLPYLDLLDKNKQDNIRQIVRIKKAIFQYRFVCKTVSEKLLWIITHLDIVIPKLVGKD